MSGCQHDWQVVGVWSGCHEFGVQQRCRACGEDKYLVSGERSADDGYAVAVWMDPENCQRCRELLELAFDDNQESLFEPGLQP